MTSAHNNRTQAFPATVRLAAALNGPPSGTSHIMLPLRLRRQQQMRPGRLARMERSCTRCNYHTHAFLRLCAQYHVRSPAADYKSVSQRTAGATSAEVSWTAHGRTLRRAQASQSTRTGGSCARGEMQSHCCCGCCRTCMHMVLGSDAFCAVMRDLPQYVAQQIDAHNLAAKASVDHGE